MGYMSHRVKRLAVLSLAGAVAPAMVVLASPASADDGPDPTQEVCGAYHLGVAPERIAEGLERGDGRYNYWRAQQTTVWPILEGDCG